MGAFTDAVMALWIKQNQGSFKKQGVSEKNLRKVNTLGQFAATRAHSSNSNLFSKELAEPKKSKSKSKSTSPEQPISKRQRTAGKAAPIKRRKRATGVVKRPRAAALLKNTSEDNKLG